MKSLFNLRGNDKRRSMLMFVAFLSLFVLSVVLFVACDKETPVAVDEQPNAEEQYVRVKLIELEKVRYWFEGKLYQKDEFQGLLKESAPLIMVAGIGLPEPNVIYTFDSEATFNIWTRSNGLADKFAQSNSTSIAKITAPRGWARLYDGNLRGTPNSLVNSGDRKAYTGSFNNATSSLEIYSGDGETFCQLYDNTNFTQPLALFVNRNPRTIGWADRQFFIDWGINNRTGSVKVY